MVSKTNRQEFLFALAETFLEEFSLSKQIIAKIAQTSHVPPDVYSQLLELGRNDAVGVRRALVVLCKKAMGKRNLYSFIPKAC